MTEPRPACDGAWGPFWDLMDTPGNRWARKLAGDYCATCPLVAKCLPKHIAMGGYDAEWALAVTKDLARRRTGHQVSA